MSIAAIIGIMIAIVVGVNLVPHLQNTLNETAASNSTSAVSGLGSLPGVMVIIFITVIIIGAVAWIGYGSGDKKDKPEPISGLISQVKEKPIEERAIEGFEITHAGKGKICPCGSGKMYEECCGK